MNLLFASTTKTLMHAWHQRKPRSPCAKRRAMKSPPEKRPTAAMPKTPWPMPRQPSWTHATHSTKRSLLRLESSAPAETRGDIFEDRLDDVDVVVDTKLIRDSQEQRVSLSDRFVSGELFNEDIGLGGVAAAKNGPRVVAKQADRIVVLTFSSEITTIAVVDERKNAAAHRHTRLARMTGRLPCISKYADLLGLLDMKRTFALDNFERRTLQIHPELSCPACRGIRTGAPPDPIVQPL